MAIFNSKLLVYQRVETFGFLHGLTYGVDDESDESGF